VPALYACIAGYKEARKKALIAHVNIHCLNLAYTRPWLRAFLNSADLVFCDGAGVILGARMLGYAISQRITGADWMWQLAELAAPQGLTFFLLGSRPGTIDKAADRLREQFPTLRIVGTHHGYFDKTPGNPQNEAVIQQINTARPDILIVGFGMPIQEHWLLENWPRIDAHVTITAGAIFDYVSGELRRAPRWMTGHGMEWLGRLLIEPRRLWRRYVIGNPLFLMRVLKQRLGLLRMVEDDYS
jgi:N-acetylglucosaminyldiphosphoundecaprenol N-acetyl-beta-D-mannosaminyltransferase